MNSRLRLSALAAAWICAGATAFAQVPTGPTTPITPTTPDAKMPPPPPAAAPPVGPGAGRPMPEVGPHPARGPGVRPGGAAPEARAAAESVVTGQLQRWLVNPNGEADGLLLSDGTQVDFPPHLSQQAMNVFFKVGERIEVRGLRAPGVPVMRASGLRSSSSGQGVVDNGPPPPGAGRPAPRDTAALTAMSATGRIDRVLYTDRGDPRGVLLEGGSIVRFPPHLGVGMAERLVPGRQVAARGWGSRTPQGSALEATGFGDSPDNLRDLFAAPDRPNVPVPPPAS